MAQYFIYTEDESKNLLYSGVRTHAELQLVAEDVEDEVVGQFRQDGFTSHAANTATDPEGVYQYTENGLDYTVVLWGYRPTASEAAGYDATASAWTGFAKAMRKAIANVVSHRLRNYESVHGLLSERMGRESWEYQATRELLWPSGWSKPLRPYIPKGGDPRITWSL